MEDIPRLLKCIARKVLFSIKKVFLIFSRAKKFKPEFSRF